MRKIHFKILFERFLINVYLADHNYIALGLSQTPLMSNTSVIECIQETPDVITAYTSWMLARSALRTGVDQTIISLLESRFIDGRIYCRIRRDAFSIINYQIFDLEGDKHYIMLASGGTLREDSVGPHGANRGVTQERIWLRNDDVYAGCGAKKVCFGIPSGCINTRDCNAFGAVMKIEGNFIFELLSMRKRFF